MTHRTPVPNLRSWTLLSLLGIGLALSGGCFKAQTVLDDGETGGGVRLIDGGGKGNGKGGASAMNGGAPAHSPASDGGMPDPDFGNGNGSGAHPDGGTDATSLPSSTSAAICGDHNRCEILQPRVDKLDLLFVVDNSNSMKEAQGRLSVEFGPLLETLTKGERFGGTSKFAPVKDLHVGVVSSDMGLIGISDVKDCDGQGDDGILLHSPSPTPGVMCATEYPQYLTYSSANDDAAQTATDLACIAQLGNTGCGFEQPLEAALKALWPAIDPMPLPDGSNRIRFLELPDGSGRLGHGDDMSNGGFLRNDPSNGRSLIAVVVLTDEDDGSSVNNNHFTPKKFLDPNSELATQPLNLRNFYNKDELYPVSRYIKGLQALRPENEDLVIFGVIAGAPDGLTEDLYTHSIADNDQAHMAFYDTLLDAPEMQETVDTNSLTTPENGTLVPSCMTFDADGQPAGKAYPPRRLVEVAKGFGTNGFVQSICDSGFSLATGALVERIAARNGSQCLEAAVEREDDDLVAGCSVLWQLPDADGAVPGTPTHCSDRPGLLAPAGAAYDDSGIPVSQLCKVTELPVHDGVVGRESSMMGMNGWYYDDFSDDAKLCTRGHGRIAFVNGEDAIDVPVGVRAILDCN